MIQIIDINPQDLLLTIMDVFVKEPLVDWIKYARKLRAAAPQKKKGKEEEDEEEEEEKGFLLHSLDMDLADG